MNSSNVIHFDRTTFIILDVERSHYVTLFFTNVSFFFLNPLALILWPSGKFFIFFLKITRNFSIFLQKIEIFIFRSFDFSSLKNLLIIVNVRTVLNEDYFSRTNGQNL